jgi:hypothetical protein
VEKDLDATGIVLSTGVSAAECCVGTSALISS